MPNINTKDIELAKSGSKDAMNNIIQLNSGLIWSLVNRFLGRGYSKEELYQVGAIGFIKAVQGFDSRFNVQFSTYAVPYIMGEIKRFIRDDGPIKISRSIKELFTKINELQRENMNKTGEELKLSEIAEKLNVSKEEVAVAIEALMPVESINQEAYQGDEEGETKLSKINNNIDEEAKVVNKITIEKLLHELDEREKKIIVLRYFQEKTQSEVAKILGISQVQISRIEKKILISMRKKIS